MKTIEPGPPRGGRTAAERDGWWAARALEICPTCAVKGPPQGRDAASSTWWHASAAWPGARVRCLASPLWERVRRPVAAAAP